jgi:hypothetical protein
MFNADNVINEMTKSLNEAKEKVSNLTKQNFSYMLKADEINRKEALELALKYVNTTQNTVFELADMYFNYIKHGNLFKPEE